MIMTIWSLFCTQQSLFLSTSWTNSNDNAINGIKHALFYWLWHRKKSKQLSKATWELLFYYVTTCKWFLKSDRQKNFVSLIFNNTLETHQPGCSRRQCCFFLNTPLFLVFKCLNPSTKVLNFLIEINSLYLDSLALLFFRYVNYFLIHVFDNEIFSRVKMICY